MQNRADDVIAPGPDPTRQARFDELAALPPGWAEGDGAAVSPAASELAQQALAVLGPMLRSPGIFPTFNGGVSLEWVLLGNVRSVEIEPSLAILCFDLATRREATVHTVAEAADFFAALDGEAAA